MCCKLNLPMFLFNIGLFTLMNMDSLMFLAKLCPNAKQIEQSRSKLASLVLDSTMKKCQEFIDKVSELRYIKIKERQVNKFNKLIKKQGNIIWFSAVPPAGNPQANNSSGESADAQAARATPLASPVRSQAPQAENTDAQAVSASPPGSVQAGADTQAIRASSPSSPVRSQAENADAQAASTSPSGSAQVPRKVLISRQSVVLPWLPQLGFKHPR